MTHSSRRVASQAAREHSAGWPAVHDICVSLGHVPPLSALEPEWCRLEERGGGSFFNSWAWIGCWLDLLPPRFRPLLLKAEASGSVVGLGVLVPNSVRRRKLITSHGLFLHTTGEPELDELSIEYNGVLTEPGWEAEVARACLDHFAADPAWDEWFVDGAARPEIYEAIAGGDTRSRTERRRSCWAVDLDGLRASGTDYLSSLGKRTRHKIRRSLREFQKRGAVRLEGARTPAEALEFLDGLKLLHERHWTERGTQGAFANAFFDRFHTRLVQTRHQDGSVQLLRLSAGDTVLGFIYNLVQRGRHVYYYQCGFDYDVFPREVPGYVANALAVAHWLEHGAGTYDLMSADAGYKEHLAQPAGSLGWVVLQRARLKFRLEHLLRSAWRRF